MKRVYSESFRAAAWYASLALLVTICVLAISFSRHLATANAQTTPNIAWPKPPYSPTNVSFSAATNQSLVAAPSAGAECVYSMSFTNSGASGVTLSIYQDGGTVAAATTWLAPNGGSAFWPMASNEKSPWFVTNLTTAFVVKTSAAVQINGSVYAAVCP